MKRFIAQVVVLKNAGEDSVNRDFGSVLDADERSPRVSIARWGEEGVVRYRIPALACSSRGTLVAAFDARPSMEDLPEHIRVEYRRSVDGGRRWSEKRVLFGDGKWSFGDPSLISDVIRDRFVCLATSTCGKGFIDSRIGNDPKDTRITQIVVSISDDDGETWNRRTITSQVKNPAWRGMFATSGTGLQILSKRFRGRLVQPCVVRIGDASYTVMALSDDGGETWWHGDPVGPGADETAVVEVAEGHLLLSIRATGRRYEAFSVDGGQSFTAMVPVAAHVDPGNNGSLLSLRTPEAPTGDSLDRVVMLSNTPDPDIRQNLSLSFSFDDGKTWPSRTLLVAGSTGYSTMVCLEDNVIGLLYEHDGYSALSFRRIPLSELDASPLLVWCDGAPTLRAGEPSILKVKVRNTGGEAVQNVEITLLEDFSVSSTKAHFEELAPGEERCEEVAVVAPEAWGGLRTLKIESTCDMAHHPFSAKKTGLRSFSEQRVIVIAAGSPQPSLAVEAVIDAVYPDPDFPGLLGDLVVPWVRVRNTGNVGLCHVSLQSVRGRVLDSFESLLPGESVTFRDRSKLAHQITQNDVNQGYWSAEFVATALDGQQKILSRGVVKPLVLDWAGLA